MPASGGLFNSQGRPPLQGGEALRFFTPALMSSAPHDTCSRSSEGSSDSAVIAGCDARCLDESDPRRCLGMRAATGGAEQVKVTLPHVSTTWRFCQSQALDRREPSPLGGGCQVGFKCSRWI